MTDAIVPPPTDEHAWLRAIFWRNPALAQEYMDESNRIKYGTSNPDCIRIAVKDFNRRTRRWTLDGTHWFGAGAV